MSSDWITPKPTSSVFARLIPKNNAAKEAFYELVERISKLLDDPNLQPENTSRLKRVDALMIVDQVQEDHYILDFNTPPQQPARGWTIGPGVLEYDDYLPDILLTECIEGDEETFGDFAWLEHDQASGSLMLCNNYKWIPVRLDGMDAHGNEDRLIYKKATCIKIANLRYTLELAELTDEDHRPLLSGYHKAHNLPKSTCPLTLSAYPSITDQTLDKYIIKNPIDEGSSGTVYAGLDRFTGKPCAVKKFRRTADNADIVDHDRWMAEGIGSHRSICDLIDIIRPTSESFKFLGFDEVLFFYSPLASWTLERLLAADKYIELAPSVILLQDYLDGLDFLHSKGIMHRDIKPGNLTILSLSPAHGQLIDFGDAIIAREAQETNIGTVGWRAPEVWALINHPRIGNQYNCKIDIFGLGLCMYRLFRCVRERWWGDQISRPNIARMIAELQTVTMPAALKTLLEAFLEWSHVNRPAACAAKEIIREVRVQVETDAAEAAEQALAWEKEMERVRAESAKEGGKLGGKNVKKWKGGSPWK